MINFVEIPLDDPSYLNEHDQLDSMLAEGWTIIAHAVYVDSCEEVPYERYTLHKADTPKEERLTMAEREDIYLESRQMLVTEGSS